MELSYEKYDKSKSIKYKSYTWNSDLGKFSGFLKTSFGFFSSEIRTTPVEKSFVKVEPADSNLNDKQCYPESDTGNISTVDLSESNTATEKNENKNVMQIRCKFGRLGSEKGQFNSPHGFCLGLQEEVFIADTHNHRIQVFEKNGTFLYEFGTAGKGQGELWYPRKIAVMKNNGNFVICDRGTKRSRMQVFTGYGHFVREIALDFIDIVSSLVIT